MNSDRNPLLENEQKLLMRLVDGECGQAESLKAQDLISGNPEAALFVEELRSMSAQSRAALHAPGLSPELWKRVLNRIEQEERAAVFLGERKVRGLRGRLVEPVLDSLRNLGWRMYGPTAAFATICALFVIALSSNSAVSVGGQKFAGKASGEVVQASAAAEAGVVQDGSYSPPVLLEERVPVSLDVDWMKSRGPIRLFQDPGARSTFLIIDKKRRGASRLNAKPVLQPEVVTFDR